MFQVSWAALAAVLVWAAPVARAVDRLPANPVLLSQVGAAAEGASGRISSALDSTFGSSGYQFKGQDGGAQGKPVLNPASVEDRISARLGARDSAADIHPLPGASGDVAIGARFTRDGFQGVDVQRVPGQSKESGACSPGAPQGLSHCHTRTPHWTPAQR